MVSEQSFPQLLWMTSVRREREQPYQFETYCYPLPGVNGKTHTRLLGSGSVPAVKFVVASWIRAFMGVMKRLLLNRALEDREAHEGGLGERRPTPCIACAADSQRRVINSTSSSTTWVSR